MPSPHLLYTCTQTAVEDALKCSDQTDMSNATVLTTLSVEETTAQQEDDAVPIPRGGSSDRREGGEGERKERGEGERREMGEGERKGVKDEDSGQDEKGGEEEGERGEMGDGGDGEPKNEQVETTLIDEVEEEEAVKTVERETAVVVHEELGEASITFEQVTHNMLYEWTEICSLLCIHLCGRCA